jgi:hypothetical protein
MEFTIDDLGHEMVWQFDEVFVRRGPIERRHSRHRLHHTSSSCTRDADRAGRKRGRKQALNAPSGSCALQILQG